VQSSAIVVFAIALAVAAVLLGRPFWQSWRRRRLRAAGIPEDWRALIRRAMPLYSRLPQELRRRLDGLINQFVAEKEFVGCGGLTVTLEMRLAVASQACLLVANRSWHVYDELFSILIYPAAFIAPQELRDAAGVVHRREQVLTGQAWDTHRIILSWEDVQAATISENDAYNVVFHEFAHYLDAEEGGVDGAPMLSDAEHYERWASVMNMEFDRLRAAAARGEPTLLDPYGAENEGEFFAVSTEVFFEQPRRMREEHPALYAELMGYYRLDPASW
jgi:Mlc titration factor MtfA (ptsG expression regulator)